MLGLFCIIQMQELLLLLHYLHDYSVFLAFGKNFLGYLELTGLWGRSPENLGVPSNLGFCANFRFLLQWAEPELL